jgi:phenylalanyl-tRNA synthetase beta chain
MLVIADATRGQALAGIMGAADAEVTDQTTTILLEAANFNPVNIRKTSAALGLRTEASIRFEKGLHPELAAMAVRRAMKLFVEVCGGRAAKGLVDVYPSPRKDTRVTVTRERIQRILGYEMASAQVRTVLTDLGFGCRVVPPDRYVVRVPYWRTDVTFPDDVVEEIARATGYDRIDPRPLDGALPEPVDSPLRDLRERLKEAAVAAGFQETISYPLTTEQTLGTVLPGEIIEVHPPLRLENPMSNEQAVMRLSLRASVLATAAQNQRFERGAIAIFESARVYLSEEGDLPDEREKIVAVVTGNLPGRWGEAATQPIDFYDAKGMVDVVFERCGAEAEFEPGEDYGLLAGNVASLKVGGEPIGVFGQVHPRLAAGFDLAGKVFLLEIDVADLLQQMPGRVTHRPLSRFPAVIQDLALVIDRSVPAGKLEAIIASTALVAGVRLFDVYEGASLPEGKRSLAFQVQFQAQDRTLTESEVADARQRLVRRLQRETGAELRG